MKGNELGEGDHCKLAGSFALPFLSRQRAQGHYLSLPEPFPSFCQLFTCPFLGKSCLRKRSLFFFFPSESVVVGRAVDSCLLFLFKGLGLFLFVCLF